MDESSEMDTAEERRDPTYVPCLSGPVKLEKGVARSSEEFPAVIELSSLSDDSIADINESCKRKKIKINEQPI